MLRITISDEMKKLCPNTVLGCIQGRVRIQKSSGELLQVISDFCDRMRESMVVADISKQNNIRDTRKAYRSLGKDPTRYRSAAEALARRILKGLDLYHINNIVEINNLISLKSLYPICAYDISKIKGDIFFVRAKEGAVFHGIGRGELNIEYLPAFLDAQGYFGSTTSDSERTKIEESTTELLMIIVSFNGKEELVSHVKEMKDFMTTYADAQDLEVQYVE